MFPGHNCQFSGILAFCERSFVTPEFKLEISENILFIRDWLMLLGESFLMLNQTNTSDPTKAWS